MKDLFVHAPVLRHELRWGWRDRLWIAPLLAAAAGALALVKALDPHFMGVAFWILVLYVMESLAHHFASIRRQPGLDPAVGTVYPRWRIVLEQSAALWLWVLPVLLPAAVWGAFHYSYQQDTWSFSRSHLAVLLLSFWCVGQIMLLAAAAGNAKQKGSIVLFIILLYLPANLPWSSKWEQILVLLLGSGIVTVLAMLAHGAALMPPAANRALLLRPATLIGAALIAVLCPDVGTDALAVAACLILIVAAGERWLPSRRQLAFVDRHRWLKLPLFPFQSGFLPGLFTGGIVLGLTLKPEYWRGDIWFLLAVTALLLCWRRYTRLTIPAAVGLTLLLLLPLLPLFSDTVPKRDGQIALMTLTGGALIALAPAAYAYLKRYFRGDEDGDTL